MRITTPLILSLLCALQGSALVLPRTSEGSLCTTNDIDCIGENTNTAVFDSYLDDDRKRAVEPVKPGHDEPTGHGSGSGGSSGGGDGGAPDSFIPDGGSSGGGGRPGSSGSSGSQGSTASRQSTFLERQKHLTKPGGENEVLTREKYVENGKKAISAMNKGVTEKSNVQVAHWSQRYRREDPVEIELSQQYTAADQKLFESLGIDLTKEWKALTYFSKAQKNEDSPTLICYVNKEEKAVIAQYSSAKNDIDGADTGGHARLKNSELLYQSWADEVGEKNIAELEWIVRSPVENAGSQKTMKDVASEMKTELDKRVEVTAKTKPKDKKGELKDLWHGLAGTVNAKPAAYMVSEHAAPLGLKKIDKFYSWARTSDKNKALLITHLAK